ncbi:hypothetical protein ACFRNT_35150 [Streptomyces sp. NPDC056697]|uniref:hypothetical protein n=1 Tax=Streptomyces sp. NPDC056697 TaxID=3345915 RepID=UPI0036899076
MSIDHAVNYIDRMVNNASAKPASVTPRKAVSALIGIYIATALCTVVALAMMTWAAPELATREAWGHAVIVAVFAVVLAARLRAMKRGSLRALRAVRIITGVLFAVNALQAAMPSFPGWMRTEMGATSAVMLLTFLLVCAPRHRRQADLRSH